MYLDTDLIYLKNPPGRTKARNNIGRIMKIRNITKRKDRSAPNVGDIIPEKAFSN